MFDNEMSLFELVKELEEKELDALISKCITATSEDEVDKILGSVRV